MTGSLLFLDERVLFAPNMEPAVNALLQQAVAAYSDTERAEDLLWQAQRMAPRQLEVYIALYKFYFYKYRLEDAERVAGMALAQAAEQGGFSADWRLLSVASTDWCRDGAERVYLYSLKALGFIRLRRGDADGGTAILEKLTELDPTDQVGGSVLMDLAAGARDDGAGQRSSADA